MNSGLKTRNLRESCEAKNHESKIGIHESKIRIHESSARIIVQDSRFLASASSLSNAPAPLHTEIAILGRSNVGKSSLINALLNHKNLAKSSQTPGKTRLINFFATSWIYEGQKFHTDCESQNRESQKFHTDCESQKPESYAPRDKNSRANIQNYELNFIDFPGFGYAKVSKAQKEAWDRLLSEFLAKRNSIKLFIHLIDSRHINLKIDAQIADFLAQIAQQNIILQVFTKSDKLSTREKIALKNKILVSQTSKASISNLRLEILGALYGLKT